MSARVLLRLLPFVLVGCGGYVPPPKCERVRVVYRKREAMETESVHRFSFAHGSFVAQPDVRSVFYLVFTDGSFQRVDVGRFSLVDLGDTLRDSIPCR